MTKPAMILNQPRILEEIDRLLKDESLAEIKRSLTELQNSLGSFRSDTNGYLNIANNGDTISYDSRRLSDELKQIIETRSLDRTKYYLERLKKSITEVKTSKINDLNLNRWKEYDDLLTDSLWMFDRRDSSGAHNAGYWGNFIPQIPNQFLRRYTKKGDWVMDAFLGAGTTLMEAQRLGRNGVGIELQPSVADMAKRNIAKERDLFSEDTRSEIVIGDSRKVDVKAQLERLGIPSIQFLIMHPPYWDIIKFSEDEADLSNAATIEDFLKGFGEIVDNCFDVLDKRRYFAVVIGDKYSKGEWIPLGFYTMQEVLKRRFELKSVIVKNFDETKGKMNQKELWRYRALVGGFYVFKHEYIFLFRKR